MRDYTGLLLDAANDAMKMLGSNLYEDTDADIALMQARLTYDYLRSIMDKIREGRTTYLVDQYTLPPTRRVKQAGRVIE